MTAICRTCIPCAEFENKLSTSANSDAYHLYSFLHGAYLKGLYAGKSMLSNKATKLMCSAISELWRSSDPIMREFASSTHTYEISTLNGKHLEALAIRSGLIEWGSSLLYTVISMYDTTHTWIAINVNVPTVSMLGELEYNKLKDIVLDSNTQEAILSKTPFWRLMNSIFCHGRAKQYDDSEQLYEEFSRFALPLNMETICELTLYDATIPFVNYLNMLKTNIDLSYIAYDTNFGNINTNGFVYQTKLKFFGITKETKICDKTDAVVFDMNVRKIYPKRTIYSDIVQDVLQREPNTFKIQDDTICAFEAADDTLDEPTSGDNTIGPDDQPEEGAIQQSTDTAENVNDILYRLAIVMAINALEKDKDTNIPFDKLSMLLKLRTYWIFILPRDVIRNIVNSCGLSRFNTRVTAIS